MALLNKKVTGSSLVEVIVSQVIILVILSISFSLFVKGNNLIISNKSVKFISILSSTCANSYQVQENNTESLYEYRVFSQTCSQNQELIRTKTNLVEGLWGLEAEIQFHSYKGDVICIIKSLRDDVK